MKTRLAPAAVVLFVLAALSGHTQTIYPGKQTIDKKEYSGLVLNQSIPEKYLSNYWEKYLGKFGKVKGRRGTATIEKAAIPSISGNPIQLTSVVSSPVKNQSQVFLALNVDGNEVTSSTDNSYKGAESLLKNFADYASINDEARIADEVFTSSEKSHQKLVRQNDDTAKDIERTEKKLTELRAQLETNKMEAEKSLVDLQNKQRALEEVKSRLPK
ncbi:hypothetical protein DYBT9275_00815 [Dyadobacter sp. CECT 9275]|uniref:DUF4468 domain-containing protein n=1 Tax=Dyadobacter helix TaxID=2822344 RepID=A0A916N2U9_9BACT|nr:hypothetical protein [Dyadobacter sp. CECT 9275]CAG4991707.1 hypothetical protein DYBT9275_00815 [Dyadobacter sp. CECT 9275]